MKHRFLNPSYVLFSLRLKLAQLRLQKSHATTPYEAFNPSEPSFTIKNNKTPQYIALSHFDYKQACTFYEGYHSPTTDLIRALIYWNEENRDNVHFLDMVDKIIKRGVEKDGLLRFSFDDHLPNYNLSHPWISGLTQGKAISLLIRAFWTSGKELYLDAAKKALHAMVLPINEGGTLRVLDNGMTWIEEYPDLNTPSMVLNGHLFTIIGIADYLHVVDDLTVRTLYKELLESTLSYLPNYFQNDIILYSMASWKPCNIHYLKIMQPLAQHLYQITEIEDFKKLDLWLRKHSNEKLFWSLSSGKS